MASKQVPSVRQKAPPAAPGLGAGLLELLGKVPSSTWQASDTPQGHARHVAGIAAAKAAAAAGTLALPPGPLAWITLFPEMFAVWRIQANMVADIAAVYGKSSSLTREHMLHCLFRHTAAQAVRDLVVRVGERVLVKRLSLSVMQGVTQAIGVRVTQRAFGRGVARWVPVLGALGVGAYAYYDTVQVAKAACEVFSLDAVDPASSVELIGA